MEQAIIQETVMAKVSLRIYNREIERLIDQGHTDEAIAHCRHILQTFPKHLETYRLLGKSYLESKRYNDAVDIFGRVLMAVPNDFVAHVGLSIVRDEENKLDDSIWHMERAFEAQPSNAAIQGELQRLYARRDGMEPPKIRMTRGALAQMYVQGELYPQAVAEIRAVLSQDPQRSDMQVLLALSYFKAGQKSDASDICNQLLKRYPYCFDANRIMVDLLPATAGAAESTQVYRMRVGELDPYSNFVKGSIFQVGDVSDASVNLERLEYSGDEVPMGQDWSSSLGIGLGASDAPALGTSSANQPDWLKSGGFTDETPQAAPEPDTTSETSGEIPEFLRAAGWGESNAPEQPTSIFDEEPAEELAPADLPDWLKGQVPASDDLDRTAEPAPEIMQSAETPDWLSGLGGADSSDTSQADSTSAGDAPDWLSGLGDGKPSDEPAQPADIPDWLGGAEPKSEPAPSVESLGASAQEQDDAVAWLESLAAKHGAKPEELVTDPNKRNETPPEWVAQAQNIGEQAPAQPNVQDLGASAQEQDDAVAWLESLAAKHGAKPEELVTDPNKRSETPPEWVQHAQTIGESKSEPAEETPKSDWVENAQNIGEQFFSEFESPSTPASATDETGMWLRDLDDKEKQEKPAEEQNLQRGDIPEWLSDAQQPADAQPADLPTWLGGAEDEPTAQGASVTNQDLSEWLSGLDDEPGLDFDPEIIRASARPPFSDPAPRGGEKSLEEQPARSDLPDWLSDVDSRKQEEDVDDDAWKKSIEEKAVSPASPPGEEPPVTLTVDLPDWLQESSQTDEVDEVDTSLQQPTPTSPSDWHPLEEKPEMASTVSTPKPKPAPSQTRAQPIMQNPPSPKPGEPLAVPSTKKKKSRSSKALGQSDVDVLNQAKGELDRGDIPAALDHYGKLIRKGKYLEETIGHLTESIYRYPVEVSIWQALGDAYMRANRLKEALEAYNKAEELIR
jgi:tetratricopeptide (TPR) repeat protein